MLKFGTEEIRDLAIYAHVKVAVATYLWHGKRIYSWIVLEKLFSPKININAQMPLFKTSCQTVTWYVALLFLCQTYLNLQFSSFRSNNGKAIYSCCERMACYPNFSYLLYFPFQRLKMSEVSGTKCIVGSIIMERDFSPETCWVSKPRHNMIKK